MNRAAALLLLLAACGEAARPDANVNVAADGEFAGAIVFEDGVSISGISVTPARWAAGEAGTIAFEASGDLGPVEVGITPPHAIGRQVAVGGIGAPPVDVPPDRREVWRTVDVWAGPGEIVLEVPAPWHPSAAVVALRRPASPARQGPRTARGEAILAMVPVQPAPTRVMATRASVAIAPDGVLDEPPWDRAAAYELVGSLDGEPVAPRTRVKLLWDDAALYVAAQLDDRDVWTSFTAQDDPLWKEEAFELFVFGDTSRENYLEFQVSAAGVTFDARFPRYRKGDEAWDSAWRTGVAVDGTLDNRRDRDRGWIAEIAVGWDEICEHTSVTCPVAPGTSIRVNAFRLERPRKGRPLGMALSPTGVPDFHAPENAAVLELEP